MSIFSKKDKVPVYFDFNDGLGKVPAHRHPFGLGWVAETAVVADSVYVGPLARVHGRAEIDGAAVIAGHADVSGYAKIRDRVSIDGNAVVAGFTLLEDDVVLGGGLFCQWLNASWWHTPCK